MLRNVLAAAASGTSKPTQKSDHHLPLPSPINYNTSSGRPSSSSSPSLSTSFLFPASKNPFLYSGKRSAAAVIGIAEALDGCDDDDDPAETGNGAVVLFGSKLQVHVSPIGSTTTTESPASSPIEFGIKTNNPPAPPPPVASSFLSAREMELSEEYTCVISHGMNPTTTHIFDGCVVESCGGRGAGENGFSIPAKVGAFRRRRESPEEATLR